MACPIQLLNVLVILLPMLNTFFALLLLNLPPSGLTPLPLLYMELDKGQVSPLEYVVFFIRTCSICIQVQAPLLPI